MIRITQNDNRQLYAGEDCVEIFDAGDIFYFTKYAAYVSPLRKELVYSGETLGSTLVEKYHLYKFKLLSKFPYRKEAQNEYMKSWDARMAYALEEASCAW